VRGVLSPHQRSTAKAATAAASRSSKKLKIIRWRPDSTPSTITTAIETASMVVTIASRGRIPLTFGRSTHAAVTTPRI